MLNALKVVGKEKEDVKIVLNGAGAAGVAITKLLLSMGFENIIMCDSKGIIFEGRENSMNDIKHEMSRVTNLEKIEGSLQLQ